MLSSIDILAGFLVHFSVLSVHALVREIVGRAVDFTWSPSNQIIGSVSRIPSIPSKANLIVRCVTERLSDFLAFVSRFFYAIYNICEGLVI